jgi:hypothetical protein
MNKRIEIKDNIKQQLEESLAINVYKSRYMLASVDKLPCVCIYSSDEAYEKNKSNDLYENNCDINIVYFVSGKDCTEDIETGLLDIDDTIDSACIEIENLFCKSWVTLNGLVYNMELISTHTEVGSIQDLEEIIGMANLKFLVNYKVTL